MRLMKSRIGNVKISDWDEVAQHAIRLYQEQLK